MGAPPVTEVAAPPAAPPASEGRRPSLLRRLFAGDRRVWIAAAAVGLPLFLLILVWCLVPRDYYTGTDSVEDYTYVAQTPAGQPMCVPGVYLPAGTARVRLMNLSHTQTRPVLHLAIYTAAGTTTSQLGPTHVGPDRISPAIFPIPQTAAHPGAVPATLCLTAGDVVNWGGTGAPQGGAAPTIGGRPIAGRVAVWFMPRAGAKRSYFAELGDILSRAALFRPGIVGPWTYAVLLFAVLPALALAAIRTLAVAVGGSARRLGAWLFVIAALNFACWALITPPFQGPDEPDHFAYTQSLVERGQAPSRDPNSPLARWSTAETRILQATSFIGNHQIGDSRAPWQAAQQDAYRESLKLRPVRRDDGGGNETAATHGPLYYLALAPAYAATRGGSVSSQNTAMRLVSGLLGALTVLFTFMLGRELAPRRAWLGVAAALLVAFEPMFGFISGIVNNDVGVNAGAAALELLLLRMLRRGITVPWGALTGVMLILLPIVKGTALALYPAAALILAATLWRHHTRRDLAGVGTLAVTAVAVQELSTHLAGVLHRSSGNSPGVGSSVGASTSALHDVKGYLSYLYQALTPRGWWFQRTPHFQGTANPDFVIFVERGFGAFGWYDIFWPAWVYTVILVTMLATPLLALVAAVREWTWVRIHWMECAAIILFPIVVIAGFEAAFYTPDSRQYIAEFGRYVFPAIGPLALLVVGALHAFGRRAVVYAGAGLATAMIALSVAGQLLTLTAFFA